MVTALDKTQLMLCGRFQALYRVGQKTKATLFYGL